MVITIASCSGVLLLQFFFVVNTQSIDELLGIIIIVIIYLSVWS